MIDENDISVELKGYYEARAQAVVKALQRRSVNAQFVPTRAEALPAVMALIPEGAKIVRGDSMSVDQVGVIPAIRQRNKNPLVDPFERNPDGSLAPGVKEHREDMWREAFTADIFITGANAVTLDGKLVSTDATGNRVAPVIFGPKKVILVIGANKIVKDQDEAIQRVHTICAPVNARRHALKHFRPEWGELPCARTGQCVDCNHEWRLCRSTVIIEGCFAWVKGRINVVMVGEALGI